MKKTYWIISGLIVLVLVLGAALFIKGNQTSSVADKPQGKQKQLVTTQDARKVKQKTLTFLHHFDKGTKLTPEELNTLTANVMTKHFVENVLPQDQENERWFGHFGLGTFYNAHFNFVPKQGLKMKNAVGTIKNLGMTSVQKDEVHDTVTVYFEVDNDIDTNKKEWIEWRHNVCRLEDSCGEFCGQYRKPVAPIIAHKIRVAFFGSPLSNRKN